MYQEVCCSNISSGIRLIQETSEEKLFH